MFLSYANCTLTTASISAQPSSTSWLWQTNKEHCVCWRSQRISELPRGVRWVQFNWVSRSAAWNEIDTCVCLSESLANGMHVSQTSDLPTSPFFFCLQSIYMERYFRLEENVLKDFLLKQDLWEKEKKPEAPSPEATVRRFGNFQLAICWRWLDDGVGKSTVNIGNNKKKILTMS